MSDTKYIVTYYEMEHDPDEIFVLKIRVCNTLSECMNQLTEINHTVTMKLVSVVTN